MVLRVLIGRILSGDTAFDWDEFAIGFLACAVLFWCIMSFWMIAETLIGGRVLTNPDHLELKFLIFACVCVGVVLVLLVFRGGVVLPGVFDCFKEC